jgi:hypothetical protein
VAVHSVGELADGTPYFIMQYVDGRSMAQRIEQEGPLSVPEARRALGEVAAALAAAHKQGIVHRDIKPANVLFEDATGRVLVSDFGIAAIGRDGPTPPINTKLTATGSILGTPQYMSPEQLLAEPVTDKTDVYSLGLLAHELLAGSAPFKGTSPHELIAAHLRDVPARLSIRRPEVDPELEDVVARCLEKDAASRPTADEVAKRLVPGAGTLLEWPPPGLEELHGRMRHISIMFYLGGAAFTAVMFAILMSGPRLGSILVSPMTMLLVIAAVAGIIALGVAVARLLKASTVAARAITNGYAWLTVLETLCDPRGDTGNIVAGSREYAGLRPEKRDIYRRGRIATELSLLAGGLVAPILLILAVVLGSTGIAGFPIVWLALLGPWAGIVAAVAFAERERRAFAAHRKRRTAGSDIARLASPWNESFETVRKGQRLGRGPAEAPLAGRWGAIAAAALLVVVVLLLVPLAAVGTLGPSIWSRTAPKFGSAKEKARIAEIMRPFVLPNDTAITPMQAGRAFHALASSDRVYPRFPEHPRAPLPPAPWSTPLPAGLFANARFSLSDNVPSPMKIFAYARGNPSAGERAWLERVAAAPHWEYWDLLGRARTMDYIGARFQLPFSERAGPWELPIPQFTQTKLLAYASVSRAAQQLARGRRDSAEAILRGTVSVGFLMIDEGNTVIEQLIGIVITSIARQALIDYYREIGDPRGALLQARMDSVVAQVEAVTQREAPSFFSGVDVRDAAAVRTAFGQIAADRNEMRGVRMEMLTQLTIAPCTNLREMIFGFDPELRALLDRQRTVLTRFPSDSALFDLMERGSERLSPEMVAGVRNRVKEALAHASGAILRNKRLPGCAALLTAS